MNNLLSENPFGTIAPPSPLAKYASNPGQGIGSLVQMGIWLLIIIAAIYSLFNFVLAGYSFLSAGDDPKKVTAAWTKIWQTALGLTVAAGAFVIASLISLLVFGNFTFILNPTIPTL